MVDFNIEIPTKKLVRKWRHRHGNAPVWGEALFYPQLTIFLFWKKCYHKHFTTHSRIAFGILLTLLEHEILHHVLDKVSFKARHQLDNIHKVAKDGFIN